MPCYIVKEKDAKKLEHIEIMGRVNEKAHISQAIKSPASQNMTAGYIRLDPGYHRDIESPVDEVNLFLEGSLSYTSEGTTFTAQKGDIVFIKKGTKTTFTTEDGCLAFYVTYPLFQETLDELVTRLRCGSSTAIDEREKNK